MHFGAPSAFYVFWVIPLCFLLVLYSYRRKRRSLLIFAPSASLGERMSRSVRWRGQFLRSMLAIAGLALVILAIARPQFGSILEITTRKGIDLVFVVDGSSSMLAEDLKPNRLERAKLLVSEVIDGLEGDRVAVVGFAGDAYIQCPLTTDYAAAKMLLDVIDVSSVPMQGTSVAGAMQTARQAFASKGRQSRLVVLVTDGEDHEGNAVQAARDAADDGIVVYVVGVGSPEGELIPIRGEGGAIDYKKDQGGNVVKSSLQETALVEMAEAGRGHYYRLRSGGNEAKELLSSISKLEKGQLGSRQMRRYEERFQYVLGLAIILLSGEMLITGRRSLSPGRRPVVFGRSAAGGMAGIVLLVITTAGASASHADEISSANAKGNELYRQEKYDEALKQYKDAQLVAPESPPLHYNAGNALYRLQRYGDAEGEYRRTKEGPPSLSPSGCYNLGNSLFRLGRFGEAVGAYQQALRLKPDDVDAKYNLELARLKEAESQKQQGDQKKDSGAADKKDQQKQGADKARDQQRPDKGNQSGAKQTEENNQADRTPRQPGQMTREEALRLLEAVRDREAEVQKLRREKMAEQPAAGKDW